MDWSVGRWRRVAGEQHLGSACGAPLSKRMLCNNGERGDKGCRGEKNTLQSTARPCERTGHHKPRRFSRHELEVTDEQEACEENRERLEGF